MFSFLSQAAAVLGKLVAIVKTLVEVGKVIAETFSSIKENLETSTSKVKEAVAQSKEEAEVVKASFTKAATQHYTEEHPQQVLFNQAINPEPQAA